MEDEVGIYDSAFDDLPHNKQLVVASLVKTEKKIRKLNSAMFICKLYFYNVTVPRRNKMAAEFRDANT